MEWFLLIWGIGFMISYIGFIWLCISKEEKLTLADLGIGFVFGLFSWISVLVGIVIFGETIVIWKKKEE